MNHKLALICFILIVAVTATSQRRPQPTAAEVKPLAARLLVQGTYEESYLGATSDGNAQGKLVIKFEATRWVRMLTNEVGNEEFSDWENAPVANVSGSVSYEGRVKGPGNLGGSGDSYEATSSFAGPLAGDDVVLSLPEYTDTGKGFKIRVFINPKLKGKCSLVAVRGGENFASNGCANGTYFFTASSPLQIDDNDDPGKTPDTVGFGIELDVEPEAGAAAGLAGEARVYAWRGAVTTGSKAAGFKILLNKTKELAGDDKRGNSVRKLDFTATIVAGAPK
jgi:hypothetical protein